jgi:RNA polymerase sigma-70 factor (ECF subfamily)
MWRHEDKSNETTLRQEALAHADALFHLARYLTGNATDAEDLVQDTYTRALLSADRFAPGSNLKAWLLRILRNLFIDRYRRQSASPIRALDESEGEGEAILQRQAALFDSGAVTAADLESALMSLPEASRTIVLLDLEGLSEKEAAAVLDCPVGTVKSRLFHARAALRELLKDYAPNRSIHGL